MIVISFGLTSSGSTLAFEMAKAILELHRHPQLRLTDDLVTEGQNVNFVNGWTDDRLSRLIDCTVGKKIVVKTHADPSALSTEKTFGYLDSGDLKIQVVFRDPRDTVLSMLDHGVRARKRNQKAFSEIRTVDDAIMRLRRQLRSLRQWGAFPSLKLQYDDFAFDQVKGPQLIAGDLGVTVDPHKVWEIVNDRFTQKNVARPHRYKTDLSPDDTARVEGAFPDFVNLVENRDLSWFEEAQ